MKGMMSGVSKGLGSESHVVRLVEEEYSRLAGCTYLDHAGAGQYSRCQIDAVTALLMHSVLGNPHTTGGISEVTSYRVQKAREDVLKFFNTSEADYTVVFTSGATDSAKKVAELFPWAPGSSRLCYTVSNHTSCVGIRNAAAKQGVEISYVDHDLTGLRLPRKSELPQCQHDLPFTGPPTVIAGEGRDGATPAKHGENLFVLSAECNFSGVKTDLRVVDALQHGTSASARPHDPECPKCGVRVAKWRVLLDCAKLATSTPLDLTAVRPDFVMISFYKILGYPTGLGALLVRNDALPLLKKGYFGGGTITALSADSMFVEFRKRHEGLEDGTVNFLSILSVPAGLEWLRSLGGPSAIHTRCHEITQYAYKALTAAAEYPGLAHNGVVIYGNHRFDNPDWQGPILSFNVRLRDGSWVSPAEVVRVLGLNNVVLRAGCLCNPGACQRFLGMSDAEVRKNHSMGHVCWDGNDIIDGRPIGVVRASFGFITRRCDIDAMINVLRTFYFTVLTDEPVERGASSPLWVAPASLGAITVYPVKSCNGFSALQWPLGPCGLLYDREWCITDAKGLALTQKAEPKLVSIHASVDRDTSTLSLWSDGFDSITIAIAPAEHSGSETASGASHESVDVMVCGEECRGIPIRNTSERSSAVNAWLSRVLDRPAMLVRRMHATEAEKGRGKHGTVGFANDAQFLMIAEDSTRDLQDKIIGRYLATEQKPPIDKVDPSFFRPNLVIKGTFTPFDEDTWKSILIGGISFEAVGRCPRCRMINIDQETGEDRPKGEPLLTLSKYRRTKEGVFFGVFLQSPSCADGSQVVLRVGDEVVVKSRTSLPVKIEQPEPSTSLSAVA